MRSYFYKTILVRSALLAMLLTIMSAANAQTSKPTVYKIPEAGVQVDIPSGWETTKDPKGNHVITKKDAGGYVVLSMSVLPSDPSVTFDTLYAAFSQGIFEEAKKDWKGFNPGDVVKDSLGGMAMRAQKFEGSMESAGGELEGIVIVVDSPKPLGIFGQRTKKHSDVLATESSQILDSIKKIQ